MTTLAPKVNFAELSDEEIARRGLAAAKVAFKYDVEEGYANGDSLVIVVGALTGLEWVELGRDYFGPDAEEFAVNVDADTGKLATTLQFGMESIVAYQLHGAAIPEGPQRFTGGVYYVARVKTADNGWMLRIFAGAASGVQGHFDMAEVYSALLRMGACWAMKMQALYGKAA